MPRKDMSHIFLKLHIPLKLILILGVVLVTVVAITFIGKHIPVISGVSWTDSVIVAGQTLIRKVHMDELRSEVNTTEADVGLSQTSWTDSIIVASQTLIKAIHFTELRTALETIFSTIEETPPTWTDSDLTDMAVRKVHLTELRTETENAQTTIVGYECCGGGACPKTVGTDCTGTCKCCDGINLDCQFTADGQDYQSECNGIDCSVAGYYHDWVSGTCYYKADEEAETHNCEGDGTCRDLADDCPGNSADTYKYECATCKYISGSDCTGTTLGSCTNYGLGTDCTGFCKSCSGGSCVNTANGQDYQTECDGLSCTGYYWGWSGNRCYYRANEPAGTHNCEGNGTCRDAADDCPSNGQGSATGCSSASSACRAGCSGTTGPTCYTSGKHGCSTCYQCNSAGNCVSVSTSWGGGSAYGCSGSTKRCDSGTCRTCGSGVVKTDGCGGCVGQGGNACWYLGGYKQNCTDACSSHGGCIGANWDDTSTCTVMKTWSGCSDCVDGSAGRTNIPSLEDDWTTTCMYRAGDSQNCGGTPGWTAHRRICACRY